MTHIGTSRFALKTNLANLKTEVDKLDIDKLKLVPVDFSKLSDVVKNDVVKKAVCDILGGKVNNIGTNDLVLKTKFNTDKTELEKKIPYTSGLVKETNYNTKITELENKISDITNLATKTTLTTLENEILDVSSLVKKTDYNNKVAEIDTKVSSLESKIHKNEKISKFLMGELLGLKKVFYLCLWEAYSLMHQMVLLLL